jgi:hypothetical protein
MAAGDQANSHGWAQSPTRLTIELRRIAPQLAIHGLFVHSSRGNRGRVLSISRDCKADDSPLESRNTTRRDTRKRIAIKVF